MRKVAGLVIISILMLEICSNPSNVEKYYRNEAEQVIKVHLKYGFADEINTFEKTCTKNLIEDGTVTIDFWFQPDDQDTIIKIMEEVDFFSIRDTISFNPQDSVAIVIDPDPGIQSLRIQYNNEDKTVYWFATNSYPEEIERICRLVNKIKEILNSDPEYQSLPEPTGGYL